MKMAMFGVEGSKMIEKTPNFDVYLGVQVTMCLTLSF